MGQNKRNPKKRPEQDEIPNLNYTREALHQDIDRFQDLVDMQDGEYDLMCEVEGHDYGKVLIREMERVQQLVFDAYYHYSARQEREVMILRPFQDILGEALLEEADGMARSFLPSDLKALERDIKQEHQKARRELKRSLSSKLRWEENPDQFLEELPLSDAQREALLGECDFSEEEIDRYEPYLSVLFEIFDHMSFTEAEIAGWIGRWEDAFRDNPQFVVGVFRSVRRTNSSFYADYSNIDYPFHMLRREFEDFEKVYEEDPDFVRSVLSANFNIHYKDCFYDKVFGPFQNKILADKERFLRILNAGPEPFDFFPWFYKEGGVYDLYFRDDPEGVTQLIEAGKWESRALFEFAMPYLEEEYRAGGAEVIMPYWKAFCALIMNGNDDAESLEKKFREVWPDIQANPELIEKLAHFVSEIDHLSDAYLFSREDILARPDDFLEFWSMIEGRSDYDFQHSVGVAWPYFQDEFRENGVTEDMERLWPYLLQLPHNINASEFRLVEQGFRKDPEGTMEMLKMLDETIVYVGSFLARFFPVAESEFAEQGYNSHIRQYVQDILELNELTSSFNVKHVLIPYLASDIYANGLQPEHREEVIFFRDHVVDKFTYHNEDVYFLKVMMYLENPDLEIGIRARLESYEGERLEEVLDSFEEYNKNRFDDFEERYLSITPDFLSERIEVSDFPFNEWQMRIAFFQADRIAYKESEKHQSILNFPKSLRSINTRVFERIYFSQAFQEPLRGHVETYPGEFTFMYAMSLAQAVYRDLIKNHHLISPKSIEETTSQLLDEREQIKGREVFGPDTKLILFMHGEKRFSKDSILDNMYGRSGGTEDNILCAVQGFKSEEKGINLNKKRVLDAIRGATEGPVTLAFSGHGSAENWAFEKNLPGLLNRNIYGDELSINYRELGDALCESGNLANFNLLGFTCHGYDYLQNLFDYLEHVKGVTERPYFAFSSANEDRVSYGQIERVRRASDSKISSQFLNSVHSVTTDGEAVKVQDFWNAEAEDKLWHFQDAAFFHDGREVAEREGGDLDQMAA